MTEIKELGLMYKFKQKNKNNSSKSFNRNLYKKENDVCEYNSGEYKVDTTGYIPLGELIQRCGLKVQNPDWSTMNFSTDKFTDKFDSENEIRDLLKRSLIKEKEVSNDKDSKRDNTNNVQSEIVAKETQENTTSN